MRDKYAKALWKIKVKQRGLAKRAMHDSDRRTRKQAFRDITDEGSFAYIALQAPGSGLRASAMQHVHDDQILGHLALHAADADVRKMAVSRMEDEGFLNYLAANSDDPEVRAQGEWNAAGLKDWGVITPHDGATNDDLEPYLQLARGTVCRVCGAYPSGEGATAVLGRDSDGEHSRVCGVCANCTDGRDRRGIAEAVSAAAD